MVNLIATNYISVSVRYLFKKQSTGQVSAIIRLVEHLCLEAI